MYMMDLPQAGVFCCWSRAPASLKFWGGEYQLICLLVLCLFSFILFFHLLLRVPSSSVCIPKR